MGVVVRKGVNGFRRNSLPSQGGHYTNGKNTISNGTSLGQRLPIKTKYKDLYSQVKSGDKNAIKELTNKLLPRAKNGSEDAKTVIIDINEGLVKLGLKKFIGKYGLGFVERNLSELIQAGKRGIGKAIDDFDEAWKSEFTTYACWKIRGEMSSFCRNQSSQEYHYRQAPLVGDGGDNFFDLFLTDNQAVDSSVIYKDLIEHIGRAISKFEFSNVPLLAKQGKAMRLRLIEGRTFDEIAVLMGLPHQECAKQAYVRGLKRLKDILKLKEEDYF